MLLLCSMMLLQVPPRTDGPPTDFRRRIQCPSTSKWNQNPAQQIVRTGIWFAEIGGPGVFRHAMMSGGENSFRES